MPSLGSDGVPLYVTEPSLRSQAPSAMPKLLLFEWIGRRIQGARGRVESTLQGVPFVRDQDRYLWTLDGGPGLGRRGPERHGADRGTSSRLLEHDGIPFVLATYPQPWQVSAEATPLPPIRDQYGIGQTHGASERPAVQEAGELRGRASHPVREATAAFRQRRITRRAVSE